MKAIILYYSRSGNTEKIAERIHTDLACDILKIVPEEAYGNYVASCLRVMKERGTGVAPQFITDIPDLSAYDVIFLGYPVWAQDLPVFVAEFIKQCDVTGKTVIPFVTYGMTGISWTRKTLDKVCKGANILMPFESGVFKKGDYTKWLDNIKSWQNEKNGERI